MTFPNVNSKDYFYFGEQSPELWPLSCAQSAKGIAHNVVISKSLGPFVIGDFLEILSYQMTKIRID